MSPRAREIYLQRIQQPIDQLQVPYADRINDQLYSINYKTKPVDVVTFVQDKYYLGETLRGNLYPILLDDLQELFAGDYVEVLLKGGIGYGKTTFSYIAIAYDIYLVSCLKEPSGCLRFDSRHQFGVRERQYHGEDGQAHSVQGHCQSDQAVPVLPRELPLRPESDK